MPQWIENRKAIHAKLKVYSFEVEYMQRRNPIVGSNTKKRLIHPNLMVWEDTRKTVGSDGILEIRTKTSNPGGDIKRRVFCH